MGKIKFISFFVGIVFFILFDVKPAFAAETVSCTPDPGYDACYKSLAFHTAATIQTSSNPSQFKFCYVGGVGSWCAVKEYRMGYKCSGSGGDIVPPPSRTLKVYGRETPFSCSERECGGTTLLASQTTQYDESMNPGQAVAFTSPHTISPYTIACLFNPETDPSGTDYWASQGLTYLDWPKHYVVGCVDSSDCSTNQYCDNAGNWDTWQCKTLPTGVDSLPTLQSGETIDQQNIPSISAGTGVGAQTFTAGVSGTLNRVVLRIVRNTNDPGTGQLKVSIISAPGNVPDNTTLLSDIVTIPASSLLKGVFSNIVVTFNTKPNLTAGQTYAILVDEPPDSSIYFGLKDNNPYLRGRWNYFWLEKWNADPNYDLYFATFMLNATAPTESNIIRRVFTTSTTNLTSDLLTAGKAIDPSITNGLDAADAICLSRANAANLCGSSPCLAGLWKAWISNSTTSASSRLEHSQYPYTLVDQITGVANNWSDLTDGSLTNAISMDEYGNQHGNFAVWTNTGTDGNTLDGSACADWTSNSSSLTTTHGSSVYYNQYWTDTREALGTPPCSNYSGSLYCFEQASTSTTSGTPPPSPPPPPASLPPRATGLVSTPSITGSFPTSGASVIDPKAAFSPVFLNDRVNYDSLKSLYYDQKK